MQPISHKILYIEQKLYEKWNVPMFIVKFMSQFMSQSVTIYVTLWNLCHNINFKPISHNLDICKQEVVLKVFCDFLFN